MGLGPAPFGVPRVDLTQRGILVKKLLLFGLGVLSGLVAGHFIARDPRGAALFDEVNARIDEFVNGFSDGFRDRDDEHRSHASE